MNQVIEKKTEQHDSRVSGVRGMARRLGRGLALFTVLAVAVSTTTAGLLVWWYATKSPTVVPSLAGMDPRLFLAVYILLMVCPWWALLAVLFQKLNWLERPKAEPLPQRATTHRTTPAAG